VMDYSASQSIFPVAWSWPRLGPLAVPLQEVLMHVDDKDLVTALSQQTDGPPLLAAIYARVHTAATFTHWLGPLGHYLLGRPPGPAAPPPAAPAARRPPPPTATASGPTCRSMRPS